MSRRPCVTINCVADNYADKTRERIVEFDTPSHKGGLISIYQHDDGLVTVNIYRCDPGVIVTLGHRVVSS
jgi:hypothetical protein